MKILNKIKKNWNFSKGVKENVIYFNTQKELEKKHRKRMLWFTLGILSLCFITQNPLLALLTMVLAISYGSEYVFNSGTTTYISVSFLDSTHFVVAYRDEGNSNYGTAIIGTVSSVNQISYGSEYVFHSAATTYISVSLLDSAHFVIAYTAVGASDYGTAIIGTVSSINQIAYGSEYEFNLAPTSFLSVSLLDSTHFVVAYRDSNNYGTAIIGTVSSVNQISYGSEYVFNSGNTPVISVSSLNSTNFVIAYKDDGNSSKGTAIIGSLLDISTSNFLQFF